MLSRTSLVFSTFFLLSTFIATRFAHAGDPIPPPVAVCQDVTVYYDEFSGSYNLNLADIDGGSTDFTDYRIEINGQVDSVLSCFFYPSGIGVPVTLVVINDDLVEDSCIATVTPVDVTPPVISCANPVVEVGDDGVATITVDDVDLGGVDQCTFFLTNRSIDKDMFTCFDIGTNYVNLVVLDDAMNAATCTAEVVVKDSFAPNIIICSTGSAVWSVEGETATVPDLTGGVVANDICATPPAIVQIPAAGTAVPAGTNVIELWAVDNGGNSNSCTASFIVSQVNRPDLDRIDLLPASELQFDTQAGFVYQVEYSEGLNANPQQWTVLSNNVPGTGGPVVVHDPAGSTNRAYRTKVFYP